MLLREILECSEYVGVWTSKKETIKSGFQCPEIVVLILLDSFL